MLFPRSGSWWWHVHVDLGFGSLNNPQGFTIWRQCVQITITSAEIDASGTVDYRRRRGKGRNVRTPVLRPVRRNCNELVFRGSNVHVTLGGNDRVIRSGVIHLPADMAAGTDANQCAARALACSCSHVNCPILCYGRFATLAGARQRQSPPFTAVRRQTVQVRSVFRVLKD